MRRVAVPLGLIVAVAAAAFLLVRRGGAGAGGARFVTTAVDRGRIAATVTATGTVNPVTTVQVGTYVSGPIKALYADFNTAVERNQLLAKIDPQPFQVRVDAAEAELANTQAKLVKDEADATLKAATLRRRQALQREGVVSQEDLDQAESELRQARAQVTLSGAAIRSAEAKVAEARVNLAYTDIVAPVDGTVIARNVDVGQTVAASFQTPTLFLVAQDLTKMQVNASVSESDIGGVAPGQEVTFTVDAYPGQPFHGTVVQVRNAPVTVQNVVTYDVIVAVDNTDLRLRPGMTATVTIATATRADALRVPSSALRFRPPLDLDGTAPPPHGTAVWLLGDDGHARAVSVTTGIVDERFTEITGGPVSEGQRVITALHRDTAADTARPALPGFGGPRRPSGR